MASPQRIRSSILPVTISPGTRHMQSVIFITVVGTSMRTTLRDSTVSILPSEPRPTMDTTAKETIAGPFTKTRSTGCLITHMQLSGCRGRLLPSQNTSPKTSTRPWLQSTCVAGTSGPLGKRSRGTAHRLALTRTGGHRDAWGLPGYKYPVLQAVEHLPTLLVRILHRHLIPWFHLPPVLLPPKTTPLKDHETNTQSQENGGHWVAPRYELPTYKQFPPGCGRTQSIPVSRTRLLTEIPHLLKTYSMCCPALRASTYFIFSRFYIDSHIS